MKKLLLVLLTLIATNIYAQKVTIDSTAFTINHNELTFYLDKDTNTYVSVHKITKEQIKHLIGVRKDQWHSEKPVGPYKKSYYVHSGYDLGHLTPSKITMYDSVTNYHTFSMFNQAPQLAFFNEHPWQRLEVAVVDTILKSKCDAVIITGVIYDNYKKTYLSKSRVKIPVDYYKILALSNGKIYAWLGSNVNASIIPIEVNNILAIARKNGNKIGIKITK
jgi:DNA/RNA endonuclease G (NUC1)